MICSICSSTVDLTDEDARLYQKFGFAPSGLCFECDQKRRLCFRNERKLYTRKCDFSGVRMISIYAQDKPYTCYKSDVWYSDQWDALEYGKEFDFNRSFFEQFAELQLKVPRLGLFNINAENSEYCNSTYGNKNCYLIFGGDFNEDSLYGTLCMHNRSVADCDYSNNNELCYMMSDAMGCYGCQFVFDSKNCRDCFFVSDFSNCSDCILCTNLSNKSYCIDNVQYSKEEYFGKKKELLDGSFSKQQKNLHDFLKMRKKRIVKYAHTLSCEDMSGDYLKNSKNCHKSFDVSDSQDLCNLIFASKARDCFNCSLLGDGAELCYNSISTMGGSQVYNSFAVIDSSNVEYSEVIFNSHDIFGCIGLRHKQHYIFNKQYPQEEYEPLRARIVEHMKKTGEWGHFFPPQLSCFGYNETTAYDYYPLTKEQAVQEGFTWCDEDSSDYKPQTYVIPDSISEVSDTIVNEILACLGCGKNFRVIPQELKFYRQMKISIPRTCSECRHRMRMSERNPRRLWERACGKCATAIKTTYGPQRPETVYCEKCYLSVVY